MGTQSRSRERLTTTETTRTSTEDLARFFEPPSPPHHEPRHWGLRHPWRDPPVGVVPADAGLMLVLARSEGVAVIVHEVEAWPEGIQLTLRVRIRPGRDDGTVDDPILYEPYARRRLEHGKAPPPEQLRFGLQLPAGERVTNLAPGESPGPFLTESRARRNKGEWVYRYGLTPLPDPGPMWIMCEWPRLSIPISGVQIDTAVIQAAAERAISLW